MSMTGESMEAAQASPRGESLRRLTEHRTKCRRTSRRSAGYGTNHPEYKKAASKVTEVERLLEKTRRSIAGRVDVEHKQAIESRNMLRAAVVKTKTSSTS